MTSNTLSPGKKSLLSVLSTLLLIAALAVLWLFAERFNLLEPAEIELSAANCDVAQTACTAQGDGFSITLEPVSGEVSSLQPTDWQVKVEGIESSNVLLDLQGVDMFMGPNQTLFSPAENQSGLFRGQAILGACTTGEMLWEATVLMDTPKGKVTTRFGFKAK